MGIEHHPPPEKIRTTIHLEPHRSQQKWFSYAGRNVDRHYEYQTSRAPAVFSLFFGVCESLSSQPARPEKPDRSGKWRPGCEVWNQPGLYTRRNTDPGFWPGTK